MSYRNQEEKGFSILSCHMKTKKRKDFRFFMSYGNQEEKGFFYVLWKPGRQSILSRPSKQKMAIPENLQLIAL